MAVARFLVCVGCSSLAFVLVCWRVGGGGKRQCAAAGWAKNVTQKNNRRVGVGGCFFSVNKNIILIDFPVQFSQITVK